MLKKYAISLLFCCLFLGGLEELHAQSTLNPDSVIYRKSWNAGMRLRSNGFCFGAEFTRSQRFKKSLLFQVQFSYFVDPKQTRQQSPYGSGGIFGDGYKPYIFGKRNSLFTLYGGVGQKFLLAEKGKRHGVQIFFKYAAGFSLAILKPYYLKVVDTTSIQNNTFSQTVDIGYVEGGNNELFLGNSRYGNIIVGASGFRKGWKLSALPGLHTEIGMEFDFGKNDQIIKALEIGVAADFYYKKVPVMIQDNTFLYPSVYVGFMLGQRKER